MAEVGGAPASGHLEAHEPVEQEAQIRLMEKLKNHHGKNSVLVVRPADAEETTVCWRMAMENVDTPTALIFSRQNIEMLPEGNDYSQATKGAYVVKGSDENYDVILLASGSEVSTLEAGAALLRQDGVKVRIVSVPSEGLFRSQSDDFWAKLPALDADFETRRKQLEAENKHWRFVATMEHGKTNVALKEVDRNHPFYNLEGSNNIVLLTTERYKEYPMQIQGYGAGASVTAAGVFANIMSIANI